MKPYFLSSEALADLSEIAQYIAERNPSAANRLTERIIHALDQIAAFPGIGRPRPELKSAQYRSRTVGSYAIFYAEGEKRIKVARILHGAHNLRTLFGESD